MPGRSPHFEGKPVEVSHVTPVSGSAALGKRIVSQARPLGEPAYRKDGTQE